MLVSAFTGMLAKSQIAALDLAANYPNIGDKAQAAMEPEFQKYGVSLTRLVIENISLPPEVEKVLDARSQMGLAGDLGRYTQFQTAQAIPEAAKAGGAGEGYGTGGRHSVRTADGRFHVSESFSAAETAAQPVSSSSRW